MSYIDTPEFKLYCALSDGQISVVKKYMDQGCDIHRITKTDRWTYLHNIFLSPSKSDISPVESIEFLIEQGLDVNAIDSYGYTPLMYAVRQQNTEGIQLLLQNGADELLEHHNNDGVRALRMALTTKNYEINKLLLEHGADPDLKPQKGKTIREGLKVIAGIPPQIHELFSKY